MDLEWIDGCLVSKKWIGQETNKKKKKKEKINHGQSHTRKEPSKFKISCWNFIEFSFFISIFCWIHKIKAFLYAIANTTSTGMNMTQKIKIRFMGGGKNINASENEHVSNTYGSSLQAHYRMFQHIWKLPNYPCFSKTLLKTESTTF